MGKIRLWLQGNKTYTVGIGAIVAVIVAWSTGNLDDGKAVEAIVAAIMGMCLRAGVTTEVDKLKE